MTMLLTNNSNFTCSENVKKIRLNSYIIYQYLIISILYHNSVTKNNLNFVKYIVLFPLRLLYCYFILLAKLK